MKAWLLLLAAALPAASAQFEGPAVPGRIAPLIAPVPALEAAASDLSLPEADRRQAILSLVAAPDRPAAMDALERAAAANAQGGEADYEVHRLALQSLSSLGRKRSLLPASAAHAAAILERLAREKPQAAAFDYDGALEGDRSPSASPETGVLLKGAADAGIETMVLTGRADAEATGGYQTILEALAVLPAEQRAAISVGSQHGARIFIYDPQGRPVLVEAQPGWTPVQQTGLREASASVSSRFGATQPPIVQEYRSIILLREGMPEAELSAAAAAMGAELSRLGISARVLPRTGGHGSHPMPYLLVLKVDKETGVRRLRALRDTLDRARGGGRPPSGIVAGSKTLLLGDEFSGPGAVDSRMVLGAPGALAIAVGGSADPELTGVVVWPVQGPEGARQVLKALGRKPTAVGPEGPTAEPGRPLQ